MWCLYLSRFFLAGWRHFASTPTLQVHRPPPLRAAGACRSLRTIDLGGLGSGVFIGGLYGRFWVVLLGVEFISMTLATLGDQVGWLEARRGAGE